MPRKAIHDWFESNLLGRVTPMSAAMDSMSPALHTRHRNMFHTTDEVFALAALVAGPSGDVADCVAAGLLHIAVDEMFAETGSRPGRRKKKRQT